MTMIAYEQPLFLLNSRSSKTLETRFAAPARMHCSQLF